MNAEIKKIIGKTIKEVVVGKGVRGPQSQLFLIFTDDTIYEIFSENHISGTSLAKGNIKTALKFVPPENEVVFRFCDDSL